MHTCLLRTRVWYVRPSPLSFTSFIHRSGYYQRWSRLSAYRLPKAGLPTYVCTVRTYLLTPGDFRQAPCGRSLSGSRCSSSRSESSLQELIWATSSSWSTLSRCTRPVYLFTACLASTLRRLDGLLALLISARSGTVSLLTVSKNFESEDE